MAEYRVVLETTYNNENYVIEFDNITNFVVNANSSITSSPIVNGDVVADHMYREPVSVSLSGTFSLIGSKPTIFKGDYEDRLTNIQDFFEKLKNSGSFISLITRARNDNQTERFLMRQNLVLNSITWTQNQISVNFDFGFVEVINVSIKETEYEVDVTDPNIPAQTDASIQSFTDTLLPVDDVVNIVNKILLDNYLLNDDFYSGLMAFLQRVGSAFEEGGKQLVSYAITGTLAGLGLSVLLSSLSIAVPAGTVLAIAGALVGAVVGFVKGLIEGYKKKEAEQKFKLNAFVLTNDNGSANDQECERYCNYIGTVVDNLNQLNDYLQVYGISSNENQECLVYINNYYYVFNFTKNNVTGKWGLEIVSVNENNLVVESMSEIQGLSDLSECNKENALGYNSTNSKGFQLYLVNTKLYEATQNGYTSQQIEEITNDLTNYYILVSQIDMSEFTSTLSDIIYNAMTY